MIQKSLIIALSMCEIQLHIINLQLIGNISGLNVVKLFFQKLCVSLYHDIQNPKYFNFFSDIIIALFFPGS